MVRVRVRVMVRFRAALGGGVCVLLIALYRVGNVLLTFSESGRLGAADGRRRA